MIPLGFEIPTGAKISIPIRHTAVSGQTQESGKTTTLEAMIARSGLRAIAFVTKRGERSFTTGRAILPYFEESADWQFVESALEATMRERMKFNRPWAMKICKPYHGKGGLCPPSVLADLFSVNLPGEPSPALLERLAEAKKKDYGWGKPQNLKDVAQNVEIALLRARGLDESVFRMLSEYLSIVIPQIENLPKTDRIDLKPGINVMRLTDYTEEMQALVIRSVIEWVHRNETKAVTIIPEAWKFIPQERQSPVRLACERLIREGAALENYVWIDSQDLAGVNKAILRHVAVWILGVQREHHEVERTLDHIPGSVRKPKLDAVMTLGKGQFFVCHGDQCRKTYVWPVWLSQDAACLIAMTGQPPPPRPPALEKSEDTMWKECAEAVEKELADLKVKMNLIDHQWRELHEYPQGLAVSIQKELDQAKAEIQKLKRGEGNRQNPPPCLPPFIPDQKTAGQIVDNSLETEREAMYDWIVAKAQKDPGVLRFLTIRPEIQVDISRKFIVLSDSSLKGRVALMIVDGFFDSGVTGYQVWQYLSAHGVACGKPNAYTACAELCNMGFLVKESKGDATNYKRVLGLKVTKKEIST
jgi:hypothetical protein